MRFMMNYTFADMSPGENWPDHPHRRRQTPHIAQPEGCRRCACCSETKKGFSVCTEAYLSDHRINKWKNPQNLDFAGFFAQIANRLWRSAEKVVHP